jgi:hypothetical protein
MTGVGRIRSGSRDLGAGFAVGRTLVVTAHHVIRGVPVDEVVYQPDSVELVSVARIESSEELDTSVLHLSVPVAEWLPVGRAVDGAAWRADAQPPNNDESILTGVVTRARLTIENSAGHLVNVVQLQVDQLLADFHGYSGNGVLDSTGRSVVALLVEQKHVRIPTLPGTPRPASNVLYAVPMDDIVARLGIQIDVAHPPLDVPRPPAGTIDRPAVLDRLVECLTEAGPPRARCI